MAIQLGYAKTTYELYSTSYLEGFFWLGSTYDVFMPQPNMIPCLRVGVAFVARGMASEGAWVRRGASGGGQVARVD